MNNQITNRFNLGLLLIAVVIAAAATLSGVMSARAYDGDGRLNLVSHLGGDALYCVDANMLASDSYANGGFRLLNAGGQELFFVAAAAINAVPELPAANTRIAQGLGSYGAVELWRLTNGDFALVGQDEHGKPYNFQWTGCTPVGPIPYEGSVHVADEADECDVIGNDGDDWVYRAAVTVCPTEEPYYPENS